jgi:hypothetical protein
VKQLLLSSLPKVISLKKYQKPKKEKEKKTIRLQTRSTKRKREGSDGERETSGFNRF